MSIVYAVLVYVTLSRGFELWLSAKHLRRLMQEGGIEIGASHYPVLVLLHAAWLLGLYLLAAQAVLHLAWLFAFGVLQLARVWTIASLGRRWTTRIIILPGAPLVTRGPYRFVRHPNYWIVAGEIATLPLAFGFPLYALVFSIANVIALGIRIYHEDRALRQFRTPKPLHPLQR